MDRASQPFLSGKFEAYKKTIMGLKTPVRPLRILLN